MGRSKDQTIDKASMLTIKDVASAMQCSKRHITNLRKRGQIPPPAKVGSIVRWSRRVIEEWIDAGCPALAV